ncbi:predicted protein [Naegleria gruberi]|uniref:Predicted protein n=1 Tax=Naegleria gruberi TaxID=5762 RepID=D2V5N6_NAEGR|nr:uncharacterized protein NAEGRDRAFT_46871 [Naegleria gruberi]EFC47829.1 predicted protein [Naegleria gruberi]|eukprot:XP_002680573.1 predicted protein [Naegleria gruberi strain NEG-M]
MKRQSLRVFSSSLSVLVGRTNINNSRITLLKSNNILPSSVRRGFSSTCMVKAREIKLNSFLKEVKKKASDEEELEVDLVKQFEENKNLIVDEKPQATTVVTKQRVFDKSFDEMFNEGEDYLEKRVLHKASEAFSDCIEMKPNNYLPYLQRSKTYLLKGEHALALNDMDKCMEILNEYPDNDMTKQSKIDILHNRAVYYFEHEKYSDAEKNYYESVGFYDAIEQKNVKVKKVYSESLNNLGFLLLERSAAEEALEIFEKSLEIRLSEPELSSEKEISKIYFNIARAHEKSGNFAKSIEFTSKFLETNPDNYSANLLLAKTLNKIGQFEKSIQACDACYNILQKVSTEDLGKTELKRHKKNISFILLLKGNNYLEKNDIDNAEKFFMTAVESNRADLQPWFEIPKL